MSFFVTGMVILSGIASQYAPGVMEGVVAVRQSGATVADLPHDLPDVDGFVAVKDCDDIGEVIWLRPAGADEWESFLVADCANPADGADLWMERNGILVEVDYNTAVRWGTVGKGINVEMLVFIKTSRRYQTQ